MSPVYIVSFLYPPVFILYFLKSFLFAQCCFFVSLFFWKNTSPSLFLGPSLVIPPKRSHKPVILPSFLLLFDSFTGGLVQTEIPQINKIDWIPITAGFTLKDLWSCVRRVQLILNSSRLGSLFVCNNCLLWWVDTLPESFCLASVVWLHYFLRCPKSKEYQCER